ncbi:hypothetical protein BH24GEM2_BH24GEM2_13510 [soil metagenome]
MNQLPLKRQAAILRALVEGNSLRATARLTGTSKNTVAKLLKDLGAHCKNHHDRTVRGVSCTRVQCDEIWAFCGSSDGRRADGSDLDSGGLAWAYGCGFPCSISGASC